MKMKKLMMVTGGCLLTAGDPQVRLDEGEVASAKPRRGSLAYKMTEKLKYVLMAVGVAFGLAAFADLGVTVNGVDVSAGSGDGWSKCETNNLVTLTGPGPYVLSGTNSTDNVLFKTSVSNTVVVVSNLCLEVNVDGLRPPIDFSEGTGTNTLLIAGTGNRIVSAEFASTWVADGPGIFVRWGSTLVIDAAEGYTDETAKLEAKGANYCAGIGGGYERPVGDIVIRGGTIEASGREEGAGIGGGYAGGAGDPYDPPQKRAKIRIEGGLVTARGGNLAAGIGSGRIGKAIDVEISGGIVRAYRGGNYANDIGFPDLLDGIKPGCCDLTISGGTVMARGNRVIGGTWEGDDCRITITGGSVFADRCLCNGSATDGDGNEIHRVRVRRPVNLKSAEDVAGPVTVTGLPANYPVENIVEAEDWEGSTDYATLAFWLPDGVYVFTVTRMVNGEPVCTRYSAIVRGANTEATECREIGVMVNGQDILDVMGGEGWTYENGLVKITKAGNYTLSGTNTAGVVRLLVEADAKVTLDNLKLTSYVSPIEVLRGHKATLEVKGTCELATEVDCSVIRVEDGAVLVLDSREAGNNLSLTVADRQHAAAIGGRDDEAIGTVWICEGSIDAPGGFRSGDSYLHPVTVTGSWADGPVATEGYGGNTLVASGGQIRLWLPDGVNTVRLGGQGYKITVAGTGEATVEEITWYGVQVNGVDIGVTAGDGWTYNGSDKVLTLSGASSYILSGRSQSVYVVQAADAAVTFDNLVLESTNVDHPPYQVGTAESMVGSVRATIYLKGVNRLTSYAGWSSDQRSAGLQVLRQSTVTIDAADGVATEDAVLVAKGGTGGTGIGGGQYYSTGKIVINGGTITATGGEKAAGLGCGRFDGSPGFEAGEVEINGGFITANGGSDAPGVGCCYKLAQGLGFRVRITGGTVKALHGGDGPYDIASSQGEESAQLQERPIVTGGSVKGVIRDAKTGDGKTPYCVTVPGEWTDRAPVALSGLPEGYGANDVFAVDGGVYLWLPHVDHTYAFEANGVAWRATVNYADTTASLGDTRVLKAKGGTIDFMDAGNWLQGLLPVTQGDILVDITAETTVMFAQPFALGNVGVCGGKQVVFKLTNDVELTIGRVVSSDCRVNLASVGAEVSVPRSLEWSNVVSAVLPGNVKYSVADGMKTFWLNTEVTPGGSSIVAGETDEEAMEKVEITITDSQAKAAGQAAVVKKVAVPDTTYGEGYWKVTLAIDETKMPEGKKIADTLAAFVSNENGIRTLAGAAEAKAVKIPADAATSGLYYSLLVSPNVNLADPTETPHALANGLDDLSFTVAPADDPKAPRFFKVKASLFER